MKTIIATLWHVKYFLLGRLKNEPRDRLPPPEKRRDFANAQPADLVRPCRKAQKKQMLIVLSSAYFWHAR
ncbi:MAG: hypothetical protein C0611_13165 [Desulfobacteraceae bacterium]|nr:MAG: hypothetical protein C0611_13165 [Desulfobacteraceae bacterium]